MVKFKAEDARRFYKCSIYTTLGFSYIFFWHVPVFALVLKNFWMFDLILH